MRKLTTEYVRGKVEGAGYILKSTVYVNSHTKIDVVCPNGHEYSVMPYSFLQGHRCAVCAGLAKPVMVDIMMEFEKIGCVLKSTEYVNAHTKLDYICPNGHVHSITWDLFKRAEGCPYCSRNAKLGIDDIRNLFEKRDYVLDSDEYINSKTKLNYTCPNGHSGSMTWNSFQRGQGCPICAGVYKPKIEEIRIEFEKRGCVLKSTEYVNAHTKLDYICKNGHEHSITWNSFQQGCGCPYCAGNNIKHSIEYVRVKFEEKRCILKSTEYVNSKTKLDYICPNGHEHSITWSDFKNGYGCPVCANVRMVGENNPRWKGGISCDPYCDAWADKEYKESIKERDGYRCQNPYCSCNGGIGDLCIHHIDFNKKNCNPNNLVTVCRSCNAFANKDRDWHILWYQTLMNKKYGYVY